MQRVLDGRGQATVRITVAMLIYPAALNCRKTLRSSETRSPRSRSTTPRPLNRSRVPALVASPGSSCLRSHPPQTQRDPRNTEEFETEGQSRSRALVGRENCTDRAPRLVTPTQEHFLRAGTANSSDSVAKRQPLPGSGEGLHTDSKAADKTDDAFLDELPDLNERETRQVMNDPRSRELSLRAKDEIAAEKREELRRRHGLVSEATRR